MATAVSKRLVHAKGLARLVHERLNRRKADIRKPVSIRSDKWLVSTGYGMANILAFRCPSLCAERLFELVKVFVKSERDLAIGLGL
jgi:hypothetical protein